MKLNKSMIFSIILGTIGVIISQIGISKCSKEDINRIEEFNKFCKEFKYSEIIVTDLLLIKNKSKKIVIKDNETIYKLWEIIKSSKRESKKERKVYDMFLGLTFIDNNKNEYFFYLYKDYNDNIINFSFAIPKKSNMPIYNIDKNNFINKFYDDIKSE